MTYRHGSSIGAIETIDVDPRFKKQGIGLKLLIAADIDMKKHATKTAQLEVSEGNRAAIELYKKAGYSVKQKIPGYYVHEHNGTRNAVRMVKVL